MASFDYALFNLLEAEGGYVNDPDDPGGETKYGISKRSYPNEDIAALTPGRAAEIYRRDYWEPIKGDQINSGFIASMLMDFAVNAGVETAVTTIQKILQLKPDGIMGPRTVEAINSESESAVIWKFTEARCLHYAEICVKRPKNLKYLRGWIKRSFK